MIKMKPTFPELQKAIDELDRICQDPGDRALNAAREKVLMDYINEKEGNYIEGQQNEFMKTVKRLHSFGMSLEDIATIQDISTEDVQQILIANI